MAHTRQLGEAVRTSLGVIFLALFTACSGGSSEPVKAGPSDVSGSSGASGSSTDPAGGSAGSDAGGSSGSSGDAGQAGSGDAGMSGSGGAGNSAGNSGSAGSGSCNSTGEAGHGSVSGSEIPQEGCPITGGNTGAGGSSAGSGGSSGASAGGSSGSSGGSAGEGGSSAGSAGSPAGAGGDSGSAGSGNSAGSGASGSGGSSAGSGGSSGSTGGSAGEGGSAGTGSSAGTGGSGQAGTGEAGAGNSAGNSGSAGSGASGSGGSSAGSGGSSGSTGGSAGEGGSAGTAQAGTGGSAGQAQDETFSCDPVWTRDTALDAVNTNNHFSPGGIWGVSESDVWLGLHNSITSAMYHWNGSDWSVHGLPNNPASITAVQGFATNDVWAAGFNFKGVLFHWDGIAWSESDKPSGANKSFVSIWGASSNDIFLVGRDSNYKSAVWRRKNGAWQLQSIPAPPNTALSRVWGREGHVFVTGYVKDSSTPIAGVLLHFDGTTWSTVEIPSGTVECHGIDGTSLNDLYLGCRTGQSGVVHHLTQGMSSMSSWSLPEVTSFAPIWSKKPGTFMVSGFVTEVAGSMRIATSDKNGTQVLKLDDAAYNPAQIWPVPGTDKVWVTSLEMGNKAGLFTGTCN